MKAIGIYDEALIVVCADHGISFQNNVYIRRVSPESFGEIAFIPLFIKYPHQELGERITANTETIDILPTIQDVIGARVLWEFDGRSLIDSDSIPREKKLIMNNNDESFEYSEEEYLAAREDAFRSSVKTFSLDDPRADLFHFGDRLDLIGRPESILDAVTLRASIECDQIQDLQNVDLDSPFIPTHLKGTITAAQHDPTEHHIIVAVNGFIQAIARPHEYDGRIYFDLVLSDTVFNQGRNHVKVFLADLDKVPAA